MPLKSAAWLLDWIHSHPVCLPTLPGPEYYDDVSYNRHKCFLVVYSAIYQSTSFSPLFSPCVHLPIIVTLVILVTEQFIYFIADHYHVQ